MVQRYVACTGNDGLSTRNRGTFYLLGKYGSWENFAKV